MRKVDDNKNEVIASWLHISDLHVFPEADTTLMLDDYLKLADIISPKFLVVTGDFRHLKFETDFSLAQEYLELLLQAFSLDKKDVFFVPGNHDINQFDQRGTFISNICRHLDEDYNIYSKYLSEPMSLYNGFSQYSFFTQKFYDGSGVSDARFFDPSGVHCIVWNNLLNIIFINTALISDGKDHKQIIDINALSHCKIDFRYPTIMIGHHGLNSLYQSHSERLVSIIDRRKVSAYLHGDRHQYANHPISQISTPNRTIPSITCAKSAPQSGDSFSDIGVVYYEWLTDNNTYVQAYRWRQGGFIEDSSYYFDINRRYFFPMLYNKEYKDNTAQELYLKIEKLKSDYNIFISGKWVSEAEHIWRISQHEGIGRILLLYYCDLANQGVDRAKQQAQKIYLQLMNIQNRDVNTQKMLDRIFFEKLL